MSAFAYPCQNCWEQQEALLEAGDGPQVICLCRDDVVDDIILSQAVINSDKFSMDNKDNNEQQLVVPSVSQSVENDATTPKAKFPTKSCQPPSIKSKLAASSQSSTFDHQPAIKKTLFQSDFPTNVEFEEIYQSIEEKEMSNIQKWRNIPLNKIFKVLSVEKKGVCDFPNVITLQPEDGEVIKAWIRPRIYERLRKYDLENDSVFLKSFGLKPCKDPSKNYFDFNVIAKTNL